MPRTLTNNLGLPEALYRAVSNDKYVLRGDISVTGLIDSPRVRLLKKTFMYEEDVSDMIWSLFGTAFHTVMERGAESHTRSITEIAMSVNIGGWTVTGTSDLLEVDVETGEGTIDILDDWKVTSIWKVLNGLKSDDSWVKQVNVYRAMLQSPNVKKIIEGQETYRTFNIKKANIIAIIKDWSRGKAKYDPKYPQTPVKVIPIPLYNAESMFRYMEKRVELHKENERKFYSGVDNTPNPDALDICTESERWQTPTVIKYIPKGKARSKRNFEIKTKEDEQQAIEIYKNMAVKDPTIEMKKVVGQPKRCPLS